jgi:hypothetical protein
MRVIHQQRMSSTGHVVPACGAWGSTDTDWTDASGVTCVACRDAMPVGRVEHAETRRSARSAHPAAGRLAPTLRYAAIALFAWAGAWALAAASGVLPAGSLVSRAALGFTVVALVLGGVVLAGLAGKALALGMRQPRAGSPRTQRTGGASAGA